MLFEIVFQYAVQMGAIHPGCDLMLFEIVFQSERFRRRAPRRCDLMLFEIVFQYCPRLSAQQHVVI